MTHRLALRRVAGPEELQLDQAGQELVPKGRDRQQRRVREEVLPAEVPAGADVPDVRPGLVDLER